MCCDAGVGRVHLSSGVVLMTLRCPRLIRCGQLQKRPYSSTTHRCLCCRQVQFQLRRGTKLTQTFLPSSCVDRHTHTHTHTHSLSTGEAPQGAWQWIILRRTRGKTMATAQKQTQSATSRHGKMQRRHKGVQVCGLTRQFQTGGCIRRLVVNHSVSLAPWAAARQLMRLLPTPTCGTVCSCTCACACACVCARVRAHVLVCQHACVEG
jgi:hypothetical protein